MLPLWRRAVTTSTTYSVTVTNAAGCASVAATGIITVHPAVGQAFISGNTSNSCPSTTVELTVSADNATTFEWFQNGNSVQNSSSNTYTASSSGTYSVIPYSANCIGTQSNTEIQITTCIDMVYNAGIGGYYHIITPSANVLHAKKHSTCTALGNGWTVMTCAQASYIGDILCAKGAYWAMYEDYKYFRCVSKDCWNTGNVATDLFDVACVLK